MSFIEFRYNTQRAFWKFEYTTHRISVESEGVTDNINRKFRVRVSKCKLSDNYWNVSCWEVKLERYFSRKWKAKDWAWKQRCIRAREQFTSLHVKSAGRSEQGKKLAVFMKEKKRVKKLREEGKVSGLKPVRRRKVLRKRTLRKENQ